MSNNNKDGSEATKAVVALPRKELFDLPPDIIYLDGNSLGPLLKSVSLRIQQATRDEWGQELIRAWNTCQWMNQPARVGNRVGRLIGAQPPASVVLGDTLSIKVYQALAAALKMRPTRRIILSDTGNFPTDLYMAQGLIDTMQQGHELRLVEPDQVLQALDETIAVVLLTHVDYRTGRMYDMEQVTARAHAVGAVMLWDLAHSAGAVPLDVTACKCEFAVGCTYKYLNGGPGSPAFCYVRPDLVETVQPALAGWLGHDKPFAFEQQYRPAPSIARFRVGTPPVLQMSALEAALDVWEGVDMDNVRLTSIALTETFISQVESKCPDLVLVSPREASQRGSHVSFAFEHGYAVMQALIARGVIGDFRAPNIMRFGFTPLYIDEGDVLKAVDILADIMEQEAWKDPEYHITQAVT